MMTFRDPPRQPRRADFPATARAGDRESTVRGYPEAVVKGYRRIIGRLISFAHVWLRRTSPPVAGYTYFA
jgi:hypothetical protein